MAVGPVADSAGKIRLYRVIFCRYDVIPFKVTHYYQVRRQHYQVRRQQPPPIETDCIDLVETNTFRKTTKLNVVTRICVACRKEGIISSHSSMCFSLHKKICRLRSVAYREVFLPVRWNGKSDPDWHMIGEVVCIAIIGWFTGFSFPRTGITERLDEIKHAIVVLIGSK